MDSQASKAQWNVYFVIELNNKTLLLYTDIVAVIKRYYISWH